MKRSLALALAVAFLAQNTGAADLAAAFGAARPGHLAYPHASVAARVSPRPAKAPARPLSERLAAAAAAYLADLESVAGWAAERVSALDASLRLYRTPGELAEALVPPPAASAPAPAEPPTPAEAPMPAAFERPADRILIVRDSLIVGAASALSERFNLALLEMRAARPTHARVDGVWHRGKGGLRFRVNYLDAYGTTRGVKGGFHVDSEFMQVSFVPTPREVPETLRRLAPVYFRGSKMRYEVEIEAGAEPLRGVKVFGRQEELDGRALTEARLLGAIDLAPGARATLLSAEVPLLGRGQDVVNFEQTHLVMTGPAGEVLADEKAAGIVDPPGN